MCLPMKNSQTQYRKVEAKHTHLLSSIANAPGLITPLKLPFLLITFVGLFVGCGLNNQVQTPTIAVPTATLTAQPTATAMSVATNTPAPTAVPTATPLPTETTIPPTATPMATLKPVSDASIEQQVDALLSKMTLAEKIGQMTLIEKDSISPDLVADLHIGAILSGGGGYPKGNNTPEGWLDMVSSYQAAALDTRLGIPLLYGVDAVHGHNNLQGATIFPHNVGLGATGNADLIEEIGRITALETIATGIHWNYSPVLAVPQDIRWGRAYEGYSENTALVSELSSAMLRGMQGESLNGLQTVLGTPKHWIADGGAEWGTSTTDTFIIDRGDARIDEETLRRVHMPPYFEAMENGAMSVMVSYSSWNGMRMHAQQYLISDVLKDELGFEGFVVSDWQAIDEIEGDYYSDVVTAINAGIDMNMVPYDYRGFISTLTKAVNDGAVSEARIDDAVRRILRVKLALGLFERPLMDASLIPTIGQDGHREIARLAVRESLVLLKNENAALPLPTDAGRIFVAGQHANDVGLQSGGWTVEWQGFSGNIENGTSILQAISQTVSAETELIYDRFGRFDDVADSAEIGIVVIGERPYAEGYGDRADLSINSTMIARMRERADRVIVLLITGRPLIITEALPLADSWVVAWLPGSEGAGISDVLFGDNDFRGKLPFTWPRNMAQLPFDFDNMVTEGCEASLFNYGYGLTYMSNEAILPLDCP